MSVHCVIPGGQRCGSTYLASLISKFENVRQPILHNSEPKWFLRESVGGNASNLYMKEVFGMDANHPNQVFLEKSTSYLSDLNAAERIKETLGSIPIIIIIRNPVARAISHFRFSTVHGFEVQEFDKALYLNPDNRSYNRGKVSANPFNYIDNGMYYSHLQRWLSLFPAMKIVFLEELIREPYTFIEICDYLELDINSGRNFWNNQKVNQSANLQSDFKSTEIAYLQKVFLEPNELLQKLLGRDLPPEWNNSLSV